MNELTLVKNPWFLVKKELKLNEVLITSKITSPTRVQLLSPEIQSGINKLLEIGELTDWHEDSKVHLSAYHGWQNG